MRKGKKLMKTLADLKRDAKSGKIRLELIERFGKTGDEIPERLRGIREVAGVNTVAINLRNGRGEESELRFGRASLIAYDGETLTVYNPGFRDVTDEERAVLTGAEKFKSDYEREHPQQDSYWKVRGYYADSPCPWMRPYGDEKQGKKYDARQDKVFDRSVRGDAILRYRVHAA